jgi:hypothetical protein
MAYRIDPERDRGYVDEFRRTVIGHHSPGLQRVLNAMRRSPDGRQLVILNTVPFRRWVLAWLPAHRSDGIAIEHDVQFDSREDAEWYVFCRRWETMTGEKIDNRGP